MTRVLTEIHHERERQNAKWGEQNHPDGTGPTHGLTRPGWPNSYPQIANDIRNAVDHAATNGESTWSLILLEEVFEALAEEDPQRLRRELVQVAAVATQWVEAIDRRRPAVMDPDCVAGKHHACLGTAWDDARDVPAECTCACHADADPSPDQPDGSER